MNESRPDVDRLIATAPAVAQWGSDHIADVMRALGFEYVALTPGASFRGLHDSLVNYLGNARPGMLLALHEESAVAIAHGYAKVTGKPLGVVLHSNVGLLHASMAIFNAWCERVPMLIYGGNGPMDAAARRPWVDWMHTCTDQAALVRHYIKWDNQPASLAATAEAMLRAAMIAQTPPCAPTYVIFDSTLQEEKLEKPLAIPDVARYQAPPPAWPAPDLVRQAAALLSQAKRPLILAGRGSRSLEAWENRIALAEALDARVMTSLRTAAAFPSDHRLHAGRPIKFLNDFARDTVRDADVILSLDWVDLGGLLAHAWKSDPVKAAVIQASVDVQVHSGFGMEHLALPAVDLNLLADADSATTALLAELRAIRPARPRAAVATKSSSPAPAQPSSEGIGVRALAGAINAIAAEQDTCLIRLNLGWPADMTRYDHPLDYLGGDGGGGIGAGPGLAIGAALALRDTGRLPLAVLGDGDFIMGVSALWTATHAKIPLLVVIANNRSFFNDEMHQERMARQRGRPVENRWIGQRMDEPAIDLAAMARAQGAVALGPVTSVGDMEPALRDAVAKTRAGAVVVVEIAVRAEYDDTIARTMVRGSQ
ncbi:MAG TPA: thiamine pyrophosphate-binding protein [Burkholderiales bacterium]|nr:thiamine pyrophosphate-binding protein [Burkholderiales bacterium]